ncbi:MAG: rane protein [Candidatus Saccharibacteria bacterium]|nr:rane protein [Candidatus Saccharibacteria bacterium]
MSIWHALSMAFAMGWEILWALILGFLLSGAIQAVVSKKQMTRLLPDDSPKSLLIATGLGAASSSCSYVAVALARSIFTKGANFASAIAFEIASTNLVIELGIIMALLLGWQFTLAEFVGGPIMIILFAILARLFISPKLIEQARIIAERGVQGKMEAHAQMDMSVTENGTLLSRLLSSKGKTATSHYFVMDWQAVYKDILIGLLLAGAAAAWIPDSFWKGLFLTSHPLLSVIWGPIIGPIVAMLSFVCSIGNVPLAAVLWNGGISFGGVISFIFADLIILPIINIYRKYYGWRMALRLTGVMYVAMVIAGYIIEGIAQLLNFIPDQRSATVLEASVSWNYTTVLNIVFLIIAALVVTRFFKTGGRGVLKMMSQPSNSAHQRAHK